MINYEFSIIPEHRIFYEQMTGFWNKEIALRYHEDFKKAVTPLLDEPWVRCLDLRKWHPSNPKVMKILSKHISWTIKNNMKLSANIVTTTTPKLQMNTIMKNGIPILPYRFFESKNDAMEWLFSEGY